MRIQGLVERLSNWDGWRISDFFKKFWKKSIDWQFLFCSFHSVYFKKIVAKHILPHCRFIAILKKFNNFKNFRQPELISTDKRLKKTLNRIMQKRFLASNDWILESFLFTWNRSSDDKRFDEIKSTNFIF